MLPIESERLILRSLQECDLPSFTRYRQEAHVAKYQGWDSYDLEKAKALLAKQQATPFGSESSWHQIAMIDKGSDQLLGDCAIHFCCVNEVDYQVEIGFTLATAYQGNGYATEALRQLLNFLFMTTDVLNNKSIALLERLKFRREAHYIENSWFKGRWSSEYLFALLKSEYSTQ